MRRRGLRSLRNRLAALFVAITAIAVGGVYLYVVPPLETRLTQEALADLGRNADAYAAPVADTVNGPQTASEVSRRVRRAAALSADRVALLRVGRSGGAPSFEVAADSTTEGRPEDLDYPVAFDAAASNQVESGTEPATTGRWGEVAQPVGRGDDVDAVVVFARSLSGVQGNVAVVRRRVLTAGGLAVIFAALAGFLVARQLSGRIRRLEQAAEEVARGNFARPIRVDSDDELGQLTLAFNDMQRQLAQLDVARKQFMATASHELRTPLFSLGGFVELLEDEDLDDEDRARFLTQMRQQVERLRKLSVDLLDLSRLESGALELRPEEVDLPELVRGVAAEFEPALASRDAHLELRFAQGPPEALCDPVRVAQVLRILVDNALTHTDPGTPVQVTTARENGHVRLAVRDRGPGIRRADLDRIFDPFFTSDDAQGSGLGLAIASELAERMDGRLDVDSRPGSTTFTLEVPA